MRFSTTWALLLLGGCTLFNSPDRPDAGGDTGFDMRVDAPDADAGPDGDAGDPDMPDMDAGTPPENCSDGIDNDGDTLIDCDDFNCAAAESCCGARAPTSAPFVDDWSPFPAADFRVDPAGDVVEGDRLAGFDDEDGQSVIARECVSFAQGSEVRVDFHASTATTDGFAGLVLSPVDEPNEITGRLAAELAVDLSHDGNDASVVTTVAGRVVDTVTQDLGDGDIELELTVRPALGDDGRPGVTATVSVGEDSRDPIFIDLDNLVRTERGPCAAVPGLFLAVEGMGRGVEVSLVEATAETCSNPAVFQPLPSLGPITSDGDEGTGDLGWASLPTPDDEWASGGVTDPAIYGAYDGAPYWHVLASASDLDPRFRDTFPGAGSVIGHSASFEVDWGVESSDVGDLPRLVEEGVPPVSCEGMPGCTRGLRFQDPHLTRFGTSHILSYVYEETVGGDLLLGMLALADSDLAPSSGELPYADNLLDDDGVHLLGTDGAAVHDPVAVVVPNTDDPTLWLFYRQGVDSLAAIYVAQIAFLLAGPEVILPPREFLTPDDLGVDSIDDFEVAFDAELDPDAEPAIDRGSLRVWAMGYTGSTPQIVVSVGSAPDSRSLPTEMTPYPANPVFRESELCAGMDSRCRMVGFGLARVPTETGFGRGLRFLMAREVPRDGGGTRYEFIPFDQNWGF